MNRNDRINVAVVGVGNCCSALVQGVEYYSNHEVTKNSGINFPLINGYAPSNVDFVAAFDIDKRKVGIPLHEAIFAKPNCCFEFQTEFSENTTNPIVIEAPLLDGVSSTMEEDQPDPNLRFLPVNNCHDNMTIRSEWEQITKYARLVRYSEADMIVNYLPVGSDRATEFWAKVALVAGVGFVNCIPSFIASNRLWIDLFKSLQLPVIGDDMRSQMGASIISATMQELFNHRGHSTTVHYQDNVGGNTDFLNMQNQDRLKSKKISKENVIHSQFKLSEMVEKPNSVAAGPAKYFPDLGDNKRAHFLIKAQGFGGSPVEFTADLSVQDSPNSAGVVIDAIRLMKVALNENICGAIVGASAFTQKTPPYDMSVQDAWRECSGIASDCSWPDYYTLEMVDGREFYSCDDEALVDYFGGAITSNISDKLSYKPFVDFYTRQIDAARNSL